MLLDLEPVFGFQVRGTDEIIKGTVAAPYVARYLSLIEGPNEGIVGREWRTKMLIREVRERNKPPRSLYTLIGLLEPLDKRQARS